MRRTLTRVALITVLLYDITICALLVRHLGLLNLLTLITR